MTMRVLRQRGPRELIQPMLHAPSHASWCWVEDPQRRQHLLTWTRTLYRLVMVLGASEGQRESVSSVGCSLSSK